MRLPPDTRNNVFRFIDRVVELYLQSPPNEQNESKDELDDALAAMEASMQQSITNQAGSSSNAEYELRMNKLDKTLVDALAAMEESMQRSSMQSKQAGSSRKRVRKQFKKSKTKYTTRRHK
jgi:hypothetical protein